MKLEVPDNAREAFQFLALGVGIVLLLRLIVALVGLWGGGPESEVLSEACAPFHNGYPLVGKHALVVGGVSMIPRLALAVLFVIMSGMLFALIAWPIARLFNRSGLRAAVMAGRTGLLLGGSWAIYCVLCLPAKWTEVKEKELALHDHRAFLGEIPWPFTGSEKRYSLDRIDTFDINSHPMDKDPAIVVYAGGEMQAIAVAVSEPMDTSVFDAQWNEDAQRLVQVLKTIPR